MMAKIIIMIILVNIKLMIINHHYLSCQTFKKKKKKKTTDIAIVFCKFGKYAGPPSVQYFILKMLKFENELYFLVLL